MQVSKLKQPTTTNHSSPTPTTNINQHPPTSTNIHQHPPPTTINHHQSSSITINHHQPHSLGWMFKRGGNVHNWKKRFFILKDEYLYYFRTDEMFSFSLSFLSFSLSLFLSFSLSLFLSFSLFLSLFFLFLPSSLNIITTNNSDSQAAGSVHLLMAAVKKSVGEFQTQKKQPVDKERLFFFCLRVFSPKLITSFFLLFFLRELMFELITSGRTYYIKASDETELSDWISQLRGSIQRGLRG